MHVRIVQAGNHTAAFEVEPPRPGTGQVLNFGSASHRLDLPIADREGIPLDHQGTLSGRLRVQGHLSASGLGITCRILNDTIPELEALGITIVMVEQNAVRGLELADWGVVLDLGICRFEGPADTILEDPRIRELYLGKAVDTEEAT